MKKNSVYIFVLVGYIFMISTTIFFLNSIFVTNRTISLVSGIVYILSLCGIFYFRWNVGNVFKEPTNEKQLKALSVLEVVKKIWQVLMLFCIIAMVLKIK